MNHKYGRKKDSRAGCLLCKPSKANANVGTDRQQRKRDAQLVIEEERVAAEQAEQEQFWEESSENPANN